MTLMLDAFWRALAYCLHPRVILLSLLPLGLTAALAFALGWFYWEPAVAAVSGWLQDWSLMASATRWLEARGWVDLRTVLAPLIVVALVVPVIVVLSLLAVSMLMMPALVSLVAARRFPGLQRRHGEPAWRGVLWMLGATALALVALVLSLPFWLVPPLVMILPPLIWGWLTYRVMAFDALADHASREERRAVMREHRWQLLTMGIVCGYLGAAPSVIWAFSALVLILAPLLVVLTVWIYTLVFAFSSLWFAHYALAVLQARRHRLEGEWLLRRAAAQPAPAADPPGAPDGPPPLLPPAPPARLPLEP